MSDVDGLQNGSVSFIYHFFPHYRYGVIRALGKHLDAVFVGDSKGADGIEPYCFNEGERFRLARSYYFGKFVFQPAVILHCLFSREDVFVFLASPNHLTTWLGALIVRARRKRVIFWGHGFKSVDKSIRNRVRFAFFSIAHAFYTYGWRAKQNAISLGARQQNIYVGFNSLDYEAQSSIRNALVAMGNTRENSDRILNIFCISRLTKLCRYDMLLDAAALIVGSGVDCRITIVGDGSERSALEDQASRLGLDVAFLGAMYDEAEISRLVFDADVTVSPGKVGLTAMHSLMYGTPVISNDNFVAQMPEVEAVVPGYTGELFADGSVDDLAAKLRSFPSRFPDRQLTRERCFLMMDTLYNPKKQVDVMSMAISGIPADRGDDAFVMFGQ